MARQTQDWETWKRDPGKAAVVGRFAAAICGKLPIEPRQAWRQGPVQRLRTGLPG